MRWLAILGGVLVGSYMVYLASRAAHSWLSDQPAYQLPFRAIVLDPPPPSWYRGGPAGFLEDVRRRAKMPETIPLLKLTEVELERAFEQSPWTEEVQSITYRPARGDRPARLSPAGRPRGGCRAADDLSRGRSGSHPAPGRSGSGDQTIRRGTGSDRDQWSRPGGPAGSETRTARGSPGPARTDAAPGNDRIPAAARLAGFLLDRMRSIDREREPASVMRFINPMDPEGRGLFLKNDRIDVSSSGAKRRARRVRET